MKRLWNRAKILLLLALVPWLGISESTADTVTLKSGEEVKGLVVEQHPDRVILSTADGEIPVLRRNIADIEFDDPAYGLLSLGRLLERRGKLTQALSYYDKAYELNPSLEEAKQAGIGIRSRLFTTLEAGVRGDISKQQDLADAWRLGVPVAERIERYEENNAVLLWERFGIRIRREEDWTKVVKVRLGGYFFRKGIRTGDRLVEVDGRVLRHLNETAVAQNLLKPRYSTMVLTVERQINFPEGLKKRSSKALGFKMKLEYEGLKVLRLKSGSVADRVGLKEGDQVIEVNGQQTRYLPHRKVEKVLADKKASELWVTVNRNFTITRK